MEIHEKEIAQRLEAATSLLEKTLTWLEEKQGALSGEVERISATVEQSRREAELSEKLAEAEREIAEFKANSAASVLNPVRKQYRKRLRRCWLSMVLATVPWTCGLWMLRWQDISLEQRIAVKSQLLRAGAIS